MRPDRGKLMRQSAVDQRLCDGSVDARHTVSAVRSLVPSRGRAGHGNLREKTDSGGHLTGMGGTICYLCQVADTRRHTRSLRDVSGCDPRYGASTVPAGGFGVIPGRLGHQPPASVAGRAVRTGLGQVGVGCSLSRANRGGRVPGSHGLKLDGSVPTLPGKHRGGTPTGERGRKRALPRPQGAEVGSTRLSAFRFPFFRSSVFSIVIAGLGPSRLASRTTRQSMRQRRLVKLPDRPHSQAASYHGPPGQARW